MKATTWMRRLPTWHTLKEQSPEQKGVERAERFADALVDLSELQRINQNLKGMCGGPRPSWGLCRGAVQELTAQPRFRFGSGVPARPRA